MSQNLYPALELIKHFEGFEAHAYPDPATNAEPITIGYGTTRYPDGTKVKLGDICTESQASDWLETDLNERLTSMLKLIKPELSNNETCALLSFCYNVGLGNFASSTMLKLLNASAPKDAIARQFHRWNKANGEVMVGLTRRRAAEAALFLKPDTHGSLLP